MGRMCHVMSVLLCPVFILIFLISHAYGVMISRSNLKYRTEEIAGQYVRDHDWPTYKIPAKLRPEYDLKVEGAQDALLQKISREGRSFVDLDEIKNVVFSKLDKFIDTLKNIVLSYDLTFKINELAKRCAQDVGLDVYSFSYSDQSEYDRKKQSVVDKLRNDMSRDGRDYVRMLEIEQAIKKEMNTFFERIKNALYQNSWGSLWNTLWDTLFSQNNTSGNNSGSQAYRPVQTYDGHDYVYRYELERKVIDVANQIIYENGTHPDNIPVRVISDYSEKVQAIVKRMKDHMVLTHKNYVVITDIKQAACDELQSVIDKIRYKGEICVICQEEYKTSERVGILNCNHVFHSDCIYTWLDHDRTCPLCRAQSVIVKKQELVP